MDTHVPDLGLSSQATLILAQITEPSTNDLRLVVVEAKPQGVTVETSLGLAHPVQSDASSRGFELTWWRYVAYAVRNESYGKQEPAEPSPSGLFGSRRHSAFLAYVSASTFATDDYPGPLVHWFLNTEWHCVDVVSDTGPEIRELTTDELTRALAGLDAQAAVHVR